MLVTFMLNSLWQVTIVYAVAQVGVWTLRVAPARFRFRMVSGANLGSRITAGKYRGFELESKRPTKHFGCIVCAEYLAQNVRSRLGAYGLACSLLDSCIRLVLRRFPYVSGFAIFVGGGKDEAFKAYHKANSDCAVTSVHGRSL